MDMPEEAGGRGVPNLKEQQNQLVAEGIKLMYGCRCL